MQLIEHSKWLLKIARRKQCVGRKLKTFLSMITRQCEGIENSYDYVSMISANSVEHIIRIGHSIIIQLSVFRSSLDSDNVDNFGNHKMREKKE